MHYRSPKVITFGVFAAALILSLGFAYQNFNGMSQNAQQVTQYSTLNHSATTGSIEDFGPVLTLAQARQQLGLNFNIPTNLPSGLLLSEVRGQVIGQSNPFNQVVLLFTSPTVPKLGSYGGGLSMIISFTEGGAGYYPHNSGGPITYRNATISGHPGSGWDPQPYSGNVGGLDWQSGVVHCTIVSTLSVSKLVGVADQLNT